MGTAVQVECEAKIYSGKETALRGMFFESRKFEPSILTWYYTWLSLLSDTLWWKGFLSVLYGRTLNQAIIAAPLTLAFIGASENQPSAENYTFIDNLEERLAKKNCETPEKWFPLWWFTYLFRSLLTFAPFFWFKWQTWKWIKFPLFLLPGNSKLFFPLLFSSARSLITEIVSTT